MPKERNIKLSDEKHQTAVPELFSVDATFRTTIDLLIADIKKGLDVGDPKSIILGAPSGCGKSTILDALGGDFGKQMGIKLVEIKSPEEVEWESLEDYFQKLIEQRGSTAERIIIAIDEALKSTMEAPLTKHGVRTKGPGHGSVSRAFYARAPFVARILGEGYHIPLPVATK